MSSNTTECLNQRMNDQDEKIKSLEKQLERAQDIIQKLTSDLSGINSILDFRKSIQDFMIEDGKEKYGQTKQELKDLSLRLVTVEREVI